MKQTLTIIITLILTSMAHAGVDKSGVKPSVLSLPSGPGSIEGLGESFEPQLNSGTATYRVPLTVPAGRNGFAPQLALVYNSGNGNGPFGLGWKMDFPNIQRQTDKGLPFYTDWPDGDNTDNDHDGETDEADEFDTLVYSNGEELVPMADGSFRCENESEFIRFAKSSDTWTATRKDGTVMRFGTTSESRIQDDTGRIFKWFLQEMTDTNGNFIRFSYEKKDAGFQRYCTRIEYNPSATGSMTIHFEYESRPDIITDYRARFELKTAYRCTAIRMMAGEQPVRSYILKYAVTNDTQPLSLLSDVTQFGTEGMHSLPPAEFTYVSFQGDAAQPVNIPSAPKLSLSNGNIDLIDLNSDGLPDILDTNDTPQDYYLNLGADKSGNIGWSDKTAMTSATGKYLDTDSTQLADMDGDGRTDLLDLFNTDVQYYKISRSGTALKWESAGFINRAGFAFDDPNVRMADLNNDKLTDVIRTVSFDSFVWLNLKHGRWSSAFTPMLPSSQLSFDQPDVRLADMNGDRLQDIVRIRNDMATYYPSKGFGEFGTAVQMTNPPFGITEQTRLLMADINGDGMDDVLYVGTGSVKVWLNLGLNPSDHAKGRFANPFTVSAPYTDSFTVFRQCDINGNGSRDILWNTHPGGGEETFAYLDFVTGEQPYQLKTITNGIGRTVTISYRSSIADMIRDRDAGRSWPENIPFPVPVVAKVEVNDGLNTYATEFEYHDGYYDGEEKEFRGFAAVEKREIGDASVPDLIMAHTFDTGVEADALKGKTLTLAAQTADEQIFYRETYDWTTRALAESAKGDGQKVTFPFQQTKTRDILEKGKGTPVQLKWEYEYDDYGNLIRHQEHGRMGEGWDDERVTETVFTAGFESGRSAWILNKVVETRTSDENGALAAHQRHYYDGNLTLGEVSKGNLTRTEDWVEGERYIVSVRNDYDVYGNVIATYDPLHPASGHWRKLIYDEAFHTFPEQEIIHTGSDAVPTLTISATYNYGLGVMTASTDFNGHTTSYGYDTFARLTAITKPPDTGHTVEYDYVLAHPLENGKIINWVETRQRDGSADEFLHSRTFYDGLGRKIMTRAEGETSGQIVVTDTVQFNARKQPWKKYLPYFETGTTDFAEPTFNSGYTEHFYDAPGREIRMNQPAGSEGVRYSETIYEPLSRTIRDEEQTNPESAHFGCGMRYVEDGLQDKDGKGRLRQVYEIVRLDDKGETLSSPVEWRTTYSYDLLDNLTHITDSQENEKIMAYDGLGRKTFMNDPDRGKMDYVYDDAGNLIRTTDAKGQVIEYKYDGVNRLTGEYYGLGKTEPDVAYHYDLPFGPVDRGDLWQPGPAKVIADAILEEKECDAHCDLNHDGKIDVADVVKAARAGAEESITARNTKGFLSYIRDISGEEHNSYDERGRVEWVVKRINDSSRPTRFQKPRRSFYTGMTYDSMDRVTSLTYPDQTSVTYAYNTRGLLESVPNVIDRYDYNPAGQNALLELTCGTESAYTYDHRLRLEGLHTVRTGDTLSLQNLAYTFDGVSNITDIEDNRSDSDIDAIGGELGIGSDRARKFRATQSFLYDSLYRLTQAANPSVYGTITYRYDRIGNMIRKDAGLLEPDPLMDLGGMTCGGAAGTSGRIGRNAGDAPGPHAITGTEKGPEGAMAFTYDDNGNMTADRGMRLSWDYQDRLVSLSNGSKTAVYAYDYTNTRKRKTVTDSENGSTSEVVYVDKYSEIRDGQLVKYVYAGNSRVARAENMCSGAYALEPSAFYLHDHLGSTAFTLSHSGEVSEQLVNYPYGNPRLEAKGETASFPADYKFTGKELDLESGLQYFGKRYYAPHIARFISTDHVACYLNVKAAKQRIILAEPANLHLYTYSGNSPIIFIDEDGLWKVGFEGNLSFKAKQFVLYESSLSVAYDSEENSVTTQFSATRFGAKVDVDFAKNDFTFGTQSVSKEKKLFSVDLGAAKLKIKASYAASINTKGANEKIKFEVTGTINKLYRVKGSVSIDSKAFNEFDKNDGDWKALLSNAEFYLAGGIGSDLGMEGIIEGEAEGLFFFQGNASELSEGFNQIKNMIKQ